MRTAALPATEPNAITYETNSQHLALVCQLDVFVPMGQNQIQ
jgi:hypothetical protein